MIQTGKSRPLDVGVNVMEISYHSSEGVLWEQRVVSMYAPPRGCAMLSIQKINSPDSINKQYFNHETDAVLALVASANTGDAVGFLVDHQNDDASSVELADQAVLRQFFGRINRTELGKKIIAEGKDMGMERLVFWGDNAAKYGQLATRFGGGRTQVNGNDVWFIPTS